MCIRNKWTLNKIGKCDFEKYVTPIWSIHAWSCYSLKRLYFRKISHKKWSCVFFCILIRVTCVCKSQANDLTTLCQPRFAKVLLKFKPRSFLNVLGSSSTFTHFLRLCNCTSTIVKLHPITSTVRIVFTLNTCLRHWVNDHFQITLSPVRHT